MGLICHALDRSEITRGPSQKSKVQLGRKKYNNITGERIGTQTMPRVEHPFSRHTYESCDDGLIRVSKGNSHGLFREDGRWISGEVRSADPLLCLWIAQKGRDAASSSK